MLPSRDREEAVADPFSSLSHENGATKTEHYRDVPRVSCGSLFPRLFYCSAFHHSGPDTRSTLRLSAGDLRGTLLIPIVLLRVMVAVRQIREVLAKVLLIHETSVSNQVERGLFGITR